MTFCHQCGDNRHWKKPHLQVCAPPISRTYRKARAQLRPRLPLGARWDDPERSFPIAEGDESRRSRTDLMNFREAESPEQQMQNHPLIVERILERNTFRRDLVEHCFPQEFRTLFLPSGRVRQFRIESSCSP